MIAAIRGGGRGKAWRAAGWRRGVPGWRRLAAGLALGLSLAGLPAHGRCADAGRSGVPADAASSASAPSAASSESSRSAAGPGDAGPGTTGRMSMHFHDIDMRALLRVFADFTNLNIVASDTVQGSVTLRLRDVPWEQALQVVLEAKGLASRRHGNVLSVAPRAEMALRDKLELEARQQVADLEPLVSQVFQLNYQRAEDVRRMLQGGGSGAPGGGAGGGGAVGNGAGGNGAMAAPAGSGPSASRMLSRRGWMTAEARTNQLFVSDVQARLDAVQAFLAKIDVPVRQVQIEARIVEADDKFSRNLGVKLGFAASFRQVRAGGTHADVLPGAQSANSPMLSLPAAAIHGADAASAAVSLFSGAAARLLALELSALEADGKGRIVSSPRVVTTNNIKALIEQGTELPYQAATSRGATSVQFRKANLKLEVTPQITPDGNVLLDVDVSKDSVGIQTTQGLAIDTRHVQTQVLVEDGGTVVIGGIDTQTGRADASKVPGLGDVPGLGWLFRGGSRVGMRTELLVFLTPRIVGNGVAPG